MKWTHVILGSLLVLLVATVSTAWKAHEAGSRMWLTRKFATAVRPSEIIFDDRFKLKEGQTEIYSFTVGSPTSVIIRVEANPKPVNVMVMNEEDAAKFKRATGRMFGGMYSYREPLSSQQILRAEKDALLPPGEWNIVIARPVETVLFREETDVILTVNAN